MTRFSYLTGFLILGSCFLLPSCGDDDDDGNSSTGGSVGTGGSGGARGGSGGAPTSGGSGGSQLGGATGSGGSGDAGSGGEAGDTNEGGSAGAPSMGGGAGAAGASGAPGGASGGAGGAGGGSAGTGASGGSGGADSTDTQSTACGALPETVTLGETIGADTYGAILCSLEDADACRLTTNTYSDGVNPCADADSVASFLDYGNGGYYARALQGYTFISTSAGTLTTPEIITAPVATSITAVIKSPTDAEYTLIFSFDAARVLTLTSVSAN